MTDFVLIRLDNGAHAPVSAAYAKLIDAKPLKRPAIDASGRLTRVKYPATTSAAASGDTAANDNK